MHIDSRSGYRIVQWGYDFDPSLSALVTRFPELVIGHFVAIASCDSGPYSPTKLERQAGWKTDCGIAVSPLIDKSSTLPMPGFDEWYIYKEAHSIPFCNSFVNQFGFSPIHSETKILDAFWSQVELCHPLHILGAGTPNMFFITRDEALFKRVIDVQYFDQNN
ncbi:MAG: hypothetical protein V4805_11165 [Pseudomonadota bacterium]